MKKQLTALMSLFVIGAFITSGSYAYWTGTTTSSGNVFSTSTTGMALALGSDTQGYTTENKILLTVDNLLPGVETGLYHIYYMNTGALNGIVTITLNEDYDYLAQRLWITQATLDDVSPGLGLPYYWALQIAQETGDHTWETALAADYIAIYNSNYVPTLLGMKQITLHFANSMSSPDWVWAPTESHVTGLHFMLDPAADNSYIGLSLSATITGTITQAV